jgi:branched-subunit amino acid aminotransferase/4-amino-4-deoxychorismate lyase
MPTPFSSQELGDLEDRLTLRMDQLEERAKSLDVRENLLNQEAEHLERLRKDLERMKTDLIREADEQKAEQEELAATAAAQAARDKTVFKKLAAQFLDGEPDVTVEQILNVYDNPHDAAKLFMEMPTERVNELFGALYLLNKEKHKAYFNAFQLAQAR